MDREQLGSPEMTTLHFSETTVLLREAAPSRDTEHSQRRQGCLSRAIECGEELLLSEILLLSLLLAKAKLVLWQIA